MDMTFQDLEGFLQTNWGWAAGLAASMFALTLLAGGLLNPARKEEIALWLMGAESEENWSKSFVSLFDAVFGGRHLSLRCFARSTVASLVAVALIWLVMAEFGALGVRLQAELSLGAVLVIALGINVLADYVSLLEVALCRELGVRGDVFVGHSVSAMIGVLAHLKAPELFDRIVLVGPSPRYIDDADYVGGFSAAQIDELLTLLDSNYMGWSQSMAPVIMGHPDRPELGEELTNSFCRTDPEIAKAFARVTFLSDNRDDLPRVGARTLVLQCSEDVIAPRSVGEYVHRRIPNSKLVIMRATGHCPNLSAPEETVEAIRSFL